MRGQYRLKKIINRLGQTVSGIPEPFAVNRVALNGVSLRLVTHRDDTVIGAWIRGEAPICPYFRAELEVLQGALKPNAKVLDAGANIGSYAVTLAIMEPTAEIFCFEPDPLNFALLNMNIRINRIENIHTFNGALGKDDGFITFYRSPFNFGDHRSSKPERDAGMKEEEFAELPVRVPVYNPAGMLKRCLGDKCPSHLDLVKIDTQGADFAILDACAPLIGEQSFVTVEYSPYHLATHGTTRDDVERVLARFSRIERIAPVDQSPRRSKIDASEMLDFFDATCQGYEGHYDVAMAP
jgi:FkbM family methyltransferase